MLKNLIKTLLLTVIVSIVAPLNSLKGMESQEPQYYHCADGDGQVDEYFMEHKGRRITGAKLKRTDGADYYAANEERAGKKADHPNPQYTYEELKALYEIQQRTKANSINT